MKVIRTLAHTTFRGKDEKRTYIRCKIFSNKRRTFLLSHMHFPQAQVPALLHKLDEFLKRMQGTFIICDT